MTAYAELHDIPCRIGVRQSSSRKWRPRMIGQHDILAFVLRKINDHIRPFTYAESDLFQPYRFGQQALIRPDLDKRLPGAKLHLIKAGIRAVNDSEPVFSWLHIQKWPYGPVDHNSVAKENRNDGRIHTFYRRCCIAWVKKLPILLERPILYDERNFELPSRKR